MINILLDLFQISLPHPSKRGESKENLYSGITSTCEFINMNGKANGDEHFRLKNQIQSLSVNPTPEYRKRLKRLKSGLFYFFIISLPLELLPVLGPLER